MKNIILITCLGFLLALSSTNGFSSPVANEDVVFSDVVSLDNDSNVSPVIFSASDLFAVDVVSVPSPTYVVKAIPIGVRPFIFKERSLSVMPRPPDIRENNK